MSIKQSITAKHYGKSPQNDFSELLMKFFTKLYEIAVTIRNKMYDTGILETVKVKVPVISVGNLTTGGVGKTPLVIKIAEHFISKGEKIAVVSRGYGGKLSNSEVNVISDGDTIFYDAETAGDEPFMISQQVQGCIVITCKDRVKAAQYAISNYSVNKIIMDDGYQHRRLYRDFNILLIDANMKFGNGLMLPSGPLREPLAETRRADKIVIVSKNTNHVNAEKMCKSIHNSTEKSTTMFYIEAGDVYNIKTSEHLAFGEAATAICAIGQPEQFFTFLEKNYVLTDKIRFNDHHLYSAEDFNKIKGNIITTEKDAVKLSKFSAENIFALKLNCRINFEELFGQN